MPRKIKSDYSDDRGTSPAAPTGRLSEGRVTESAQFIKTITDNLPVLIAYWTADLHCLFANRTYMEWFNKSPDEMIGINKKTLMGGREYQECASYINEVLQGKQQSFERTFVKESGQHIDTHTQYIPDIEGEDIKGFYSIIYDLTDIRRAESVIRQKNQQIEEILDNITDGFITLDNDRRYTYANKHVGTLVGKKPEELIGRKVWEVFPDAIGSETYRAIETAFEERKYVCNKDHYEPLDLWQENRVYPTGNGVSMFIRDITGEKREEQHLKLLESVITNTTEAVLITEADPLDEPGPRVVYVNQAFADMTGYEIGELEGKTPRVLQGPKSDIAELKRLGEAIRAGQSYEVTTINYKKSGEEFWINFTVSPVTNEMGKITNFIAIERDVTASKNEELQKDLMAEISLVFNEEGTLKEMLQKMLDHLVAFGGFNMAEAWMVGADKEHIDLAAKYNKTEKQEIFYAEAGDIRSLKKNEGFAGAIWDMNRPELWTDVGKNKRFKRRAAASSAQIQSIFGMPLTHNNAPVGVLLLGLDNDVGRNNISGKFSEVIGNHIGAEIKRKQLEEELNQVFNFAPDIICIAGTDGYLKKINPAMCEILGYSEQELLSRQFSDFIYEEDKKLAEDELNRITNQNPSPYFENRYITRSGDIKWLSWTSTPASEEGLIFAVAKDITDKKVSEIRLRELNENLQKHAKDLAVSNAELEQFAYVASHDLQEPLRMVTSFLTQLEKKYSDVVDDKGRQYIFFAVDGAKRMRQIILDLLEFSRIGRTEDDMEEVDLNKLVNEIYVLHHRQIEELQAVILYENLPRLVTYKTPLRQVFQNLISNSLKYHAAGRPPVIRIKSEETKASITISVTDNGIGISPEYFEKIFIIFQRLHNKEQYSGTGMGLAIAKKIIENLGGKIWVESEEGRGTTFHFTLMKGTK